MAKKTDNGNTAGKLALRRWFLDQYHSDGGARVFDCCQADARLWTEIRKTHAVSSYWGVDLRQKKGRLTLDSVDVLRRSGWTENVIDIDTYGSPWNHFVQVVHNAPHPVVIFLTIGIINQSKMNPGAHGQDQFFSFPPSAPQGLRGKMTFALDVEMAFKYAKKYGTIHTPMEAVSTAGARYIGLMFSPKR